MRVLAYLLVLLAVLGPHPPAVGAGLDLHWLWDDRCANCHGHSADLARRLAVVDGELGSHHRGADLRRFLRNHYAPDSEADALYAMLLAQAQTPPRFRNECRRCHGRAVDLVRSSIRLDGGQAFSVRDGRPIGAFLGGHMQLDAAGVEFYERLLTRIATEVERP